MSFCFILIPSDGAAECLVGGDTSKFSFLPRIEETITFYIPGGTIDGKVSEVSHAYLEGVSREQVITSVKVRLHRKDFDQILKIFISNHWTHYDHTI